MTTTEAQQRYLKTADLRTLLPVGRTAFYALIKQQDFPQPLQLTPGGDYLWGAAEIDHWLSSRPRVRFDFPKRRSRAVDPAQDELDLVPVTGRRGTAPHAPPDAVRARAPLRARCRWVVAPQVAL